MTKHTPKIAMTSSLPSTSSALKPRVSTLKMSAEDRAKMLRNFATASRPRMLVSPAWEVPSALPPTPPPQQQQQQQRHNDINKDSDDNDNEQEEEEDDEEEEEEEDFAALAPSAANRGLASRGLLSAYVAQLGAAVPSPVGAALGAVTRPVERLVERSASISDMGVTDLERERRAVARTVRHAKDPLALFEGRLRLAAVGVRDRDSAMAHLGVALQMAESVFRDPFFVAGVLDRMAAVEASAGQGAKAVALEERARASLRPLLDARPVDRDAVGLGIVILFNLGLCYSKLGYTQKGLAMMADALSAAEANSADEAILEIMQTATTEAKKAIAAAAAPPQRKRY
jgi:hypothetical protein